MSIAPSQRRLTVGLLALLIAACGTHPVATPEQATGSTAGYRDPVGPAAEAHRELQAESAYLIGRRFYIRYRYGAETKYTTGVWKKAAIQPLTGAELLAFEEQDDVPLEVCLTPLQETVWNQYASAGHAAVPVLPAGHWKAVYQLLRTTLTPREAGTGAVIDILELEEWFSWYDDTGTLQWALIQDKPPGVQVKYSYRFEQVAELLLAVLESYLQAADVNHRQVLLDTGDEGPDSTPFVYANLDDGVVLFLTNRPDSDVALNPKGGVARVRVTTHVVVGQVRALVERPVTSIGRLFARTSNAMVDGISRTALFPRQAEYVPPLKHGTGMDLQAWERRLDEVTGMPASMGQMRYLVDGVDWIDVRMYIFDDDDYAIKMADILKARSKEVEVRVLLDGLGTIGASVQESASLPDDHRAPLSIIHYLKQNSAIKVQRVTNFWLGGDHAKSIIVDERIGFIGGMNIGREYRYDWHDLMVELEGPVVDILREDFHRAWVHERFLGDLQLVMREFKPGGREAQAGDYPLRVLFTKASDSQIYRTQLEAIRNAGSYIYIENAYFTDDLILHELIRARMRGVDVRVIVPLRSDFGMMKRNNALVANAMLENGIRVYIYPGMSHLKAAVYDGWICLGSANLDKLSLRINKEINIATSHQEAVQGLMQRVFIPDMQASVELKEPFPENWLDFLVEIMADHL